MVRGKIVSLSLNGGHKASGCICLRKQVLTPKKPGMDLARFRFMKKKEKGLAVLGAALFLALATAIGEAIRRL